MRHAAGEVSTTVADLNKLPLDELRTSHDPVLLRSIRLIAESTEYRQGGILQNQAPEAL